MKLWMKFLLVLFAISLTTFSYAEKLAYPCNGAPGSYHTNPDQSIGGFVASTATVDASVTITPDASVCERATVWSITSISERNH